MLSQVPLVLIVFPGYFTVWTVLIGRQKSEKLSHFVMFVL